MTLLDRGISWVQEQINRLKARQDAIEAKYAAQAAALAEAAKPKPKPPAPVVAVTNRPRRKVVLSWYINRFDDPYHAPGKGAHNLLGCLWDGDTFSGTKAKRGLYQLAGWDVVQLRDREALQADVFSEMDRIIAQLEPGDEFGLSWSGHGSTLPNLKDPTGEEHVVCFADCLDQDNPEWFRDHTGSHLEIADKLRKIPQGVLVHVRGDSCFSGIPPESLAPFAERTLGVSARPYRKARRIPSPFGSRPRPTAARSLASMARDLVKVDNLRVLIFTATRPDQTAADAMIAGNACGAWTYHQAQALKRGLTSAAYTDAVAAGLRLGKFDQVPLLEGDPARTLGPVPWVPRS